MLDRIEEMSRSIGRTARVMGKETKIPVGGCFRPRKMSRATGYGSRTRLDRIYPSLWDSLVTEIQSISSVSDRTKQNLSNPRTVTSLFPASA